MTIRNMNILFHESVIALVVFERNADGNAFWEKQGFTRREDLIYRNKALSCITRIDT